MNRQPCDQLDDFLAGDLNAGATATFEIHRRQCSNCDEAVRRARRIDELLVTTDSPVPAGLINRVEGRLRSARRRRIAARVGAMAAAVAIAWIWLGQERSADRPTAPIAAVSVAPAKPPVVTVRFSDNVLAVPEKTDLPNVTFFWVYPNLNDQPDSVGGN